VLNSKTVKGGIDSDAASLPGLEMSGNLTYGVDFRSV